MLTAQMIKVETMSAIDEMRHSNPLLQRLTKPFPSTAVLLELYVRNLYYLFSLTRAHMIRAGVESEALGLDVLVPYFQMKLKEEEGHEQWAKNDQTSLCGGKRRMSSVPLAESMKRLGRQLDHWITEHPFFYALYISFMETMTVELGPILIERMVAQGDMSKEEIVKNFTAITRHVELDSGHSDENFSFFGGLDYQALSVDEVRCRQVLRQFGTSFNAFTAELIELVHRAAVISSETTEKIDNATRRSPLDVSKNPTAGVPSQPVLGN